MNQLAQLFVLKTLSSSRKTKFVIGRDRALAF